MRLTPNSHLVNELSIPMILHVFSDSQSPIASIKNRIYRPTAVAHIATKFNLAADIARAGEIDLSYIPTVEILADCFTKPLPKPAILKQCAGMGMIRIGLGIRILNRIRNGLGNSAGNSLRNGIGTGNAIRNAIRKQID
jgi:hypothetical protein